MKNKIATFEFNIHGMLKNIQIQNFKSIKDQSIDLKNLNVLIGQNGAGKSNFISLFKFLERLVEQQLFSYKWRKQGDVPSFKCFAFMYSL